MTKHLLKFTALTLVTIAFILIILVPRRIKIATREEVLVKEEEERNDNTKTLDGPRVKNPLDGCLHVFLDLGSNRGVQIRKLYQPYLFPGAGVLQIFDRYFGPFAERNLSEVCAVGFEPNPRHESLLKETESAYNQCGWKVGTYSF